MSHACLAPPISRHQSRTCPCPTTSVQRYMSNTCPTTPIPRHLSRTCPCPTTSVQRHMSHACCTSPIPWHLSRTCPCPTTFVPRHMSHTCSTPTFSHRRPAPCRHRRWYKTSAATKAKRQRTLLLLLLHGAVRTSSVVCGSLAAAGSESDVHGKAGGKCCADRGGNCGGDGELKTTTTERCTPVSSVQ